MNRYLRLAAHQCSWRRAVRIFMGTAALQLFALAVTAADPPANKIRLPKLFKVPLDYEGVDIRHVLYHEQGFRSAPNREIQLEVVDMQPNHDDGSLWFWGGRSAHCLVQYDPATGRTKVHPLPRSEEAGEQLPPHLYLLAKGGKVYLFDLHKPQTQLGIYEVAKRKLSFAPLLSKSSKRKFGIVTGNTPKVGPYIFLFIGKDIEDTSREPKGLIRWDTRTSQGEFIEYTYPGPGPLFGAESPDGRTIWCPIWNGNALARFGVRTAKWDGFWKTPFKKETQPTFAGLLKDRFYCVDLFRPRLLPFETKTKKWLQPIPVPGHGTTFGVLGGGFIYQDKLFCSMATLKSYIPHGGPIGVDGKPWHFLDRHLCYDPQTKSFCHQVLRGTDAEYWMNSVEVLHGPHAYFTAINLAQPDGTVNQFGRGEVAIFQTHPRGRPKLAPMLSVNGKTVK